MRKILHGCTRITQTVRRAIQKSQESRMTLTAQDAINPKTISKGKNKNDSEAPMAPKEPASTVLTKAKEALI